VRSLHKITNGVLYFMQDLKVVDSLCSADFNHNVGLVIRSQPNVSGHRWADPPVQALRFRYPFSGSIRLRSREVSIH
jgi:hypothetical protein